MLDHRLSGSRRTPRKPQKRWSREALELEADRILAHAGFTELVSASDGKPIVDESSNTTPAVYEVLEPELTEEEEREALIASLSGEDLFDHEQTEQLGRYPSHRV